MFLLRSTLTLLGLCAAACAGQIDLTKSTIVLSASASAREKKAAAMLADEVEKRTQIRWPVAAQPFGMSIRIQQQKGVTAPEGYALHATAGGITITGADERGVLFGTGRLLREMHMRKQSISIDPVDIKTAPKYPLRGHQLGYRPKTNAYDAWSVPMWEQYYRDLAVFGTNAIELIPPRSDDAADSPHFPLPPMQMMVEMSRLADEYGLDVWIWYPAMDKDYSDPNTVEFALKEWGEVFRQLPRIDAVFVPGGDPGHTEPKYMFNLLEKETQLLHRYHPKAQMWMSPQSFNAAWMQEYFDLMKQEPAWLSGVVFGPQIRMGLPELRAKVPKKYPIRFYPDITHSRQSQYPVIDWDVAYAATEGREVINPRPVDEAKIFREFSPYTIGFLTYSEGCNDDVNKFVWSALGWNPEANVTDVLRQFSRYFIGDQFADEYAQGLLALERNWRGPLLTNENVYTTLEQFQAMERASSPATRENWRFQQGLYRAYYDAYVRRRLIRETALEQRAMDDLRDAKTAGSLVAMNRAEHALDASTGDFVAEGWHRRIFELAEALFQSIHMQLSVEKYRAIATDRGATLDTVDAPLNDRLWLEQRFADMRAMTSESDRLGAIDQIVNWTNPGPGGFYDDLGNLTVQPHLVRGPEPPLVGFGARGANRVSWWTHAESMNDDPLKMYYQDLDPTAEYKVRVVYAGDSPRVKIRLEANGIEVHPYIEKPRPVKPVEFDIPKAATAKGDLTLTWTREPGLGGNGRGCQVSEVWLIRK